MYHYCRFTSPTLSCGKEEEKDIQTDLQALGVIDNLAEHYNSIYTVFK